METLPEQFKNALERIEIQEAKRQEAQAAHTEIRKVLEVDTTLREWGVDTILIGSYSRSTGIHPGKDVDVFMRLASLDADADPGEVFDHVAEVLTTHYGSRATKQRRSVKVDFSNDGFSVDAVPAVRSGSRWGIPNGDTARWGGSAEERWVETDPLTLGELTTTMNGTLKVNGQGAYVPTVKLVRQIRRHHLGDGRPGGLYFELMTYWAFQGGVTGDSFAEILAATLRSIATQLASAGDLIDPALGTAFSPPPDPADRTKAAGVFEDLADDAEAALDLDRCPAAARWRRIIGENKNGVCFTLPDGCDEDGNPIRSITKSLSLGSREAAGFAGA